MVLSKPHGHELHVHGITSDMLIKSYVLNCKLAIPTLKPPLT